MIIDYYTTEYLQRGMEHGALCGRGGHGCHAAQVRAPCMTDHGYGRAEDTIHTCSDAEGRSVAAVACLTMNDASITTSARHPPLPTVPCTGTSHSLLGPVTGWPLIVRGRYCTVLAMGSAHGMNQSCCHDALLVPVLTSSSTSSSSSSSSRTYYCQTI